MSNKKLAVGDEVVKVFYLYANPAVLQVEPRRIEEFYRNGNFVLAGDVSRTQWLPSGEPAKRSSGSETFAVFVTYPDDPRIADLQRKATLYQLICTLADATTELRAVTHNSDVFPASLEGQLESLTAAVRLATASIVALR